MSDPSSSPDRHSRRLWILSAASLGVGLAIFAVLAPARFRFWYDSWTYLELARSVWRDFYAVATIREFSGVTAQSSAFPPLWPVVIAMLVLLWDSMAAAYLAAFAAYAAFAVLAERLATRMFGMAGIGFTSALLLLAFPGMRWDLAGGGSIALFLCFLALLASLFLDLDPQSPRHAAALGVLAGAMLMLRFDAAPASAAALLAGMALGFRGRRILVLLVAFVLAISPWVAYSLRHFGTAFVTDNAAVALALDPDAYVMDFHAAPQPMLPDDPAAWVAKLVAHVPVIATAIADAAMQSVFLVPVVFIAGAAWFWRRGAPVPASLRSRGFLALVLVVAAPLAAYVVTGYQESRYFSAAVWLGELAALGIAFAFVAPRFRLALCALLCAAGVAKSAALLRYASERPPLAAMRAQLSTHDVDSLTACLGRDGATKEDGVLFLTNHDYLNGYRFGALSGWRASPPPRNWPTLTPEHRGEFVRRYRLAFVIDTLPGAAGRLPTEPVAGCPAMVHRLMGGPSAR